MCVRVGIVFSIRCDRCLVCRPCVQCLRSIIVACCVGIKKPSVCIKPSVSLEDVVS